MNHIEFIFTGKSKSEKTTFVGHINLGTVKHEIGIKHFTGKVYVYNSNKLEWTINCVDGTFSGDFTKYIDYVPSSVTGYISGYVTFNWRQPQIIAKFRNGLLDGPVSVYKGDGSKEFLMNYSMGMLEGDQKHYINSSRVIHKYSKGVWKQSYSQSKAWFGDTQVDEILSHKELKLRHLMIQK